MDDDSGCDHDDGCYYDTRGVGYDDNGHIDDGDGDDCEIDGEFVGEGDVSDAWW